MQFCSLCVSHLCPGMMGTLSWAVLNVTTLSLTRGRLWRPWPRSGAMLASAFYEKSDFSFFSFLAKNCERRMSKQKDWQLDFAFKKKKATKSEPQKGHVFMPVCKKAFSTERSASCLWHVGSARLEVEFRCGRLGKRPQRSSSPLAWLSSVSLSLPMRLFFQFVLKVQYISTYYDKTFTKEREMELI